MKRSKHHIGSTKAKRRAALLEGCLVHHQGEKALRAVRNKRRALPFSARDGAFLQPASPSGTSLAPAPADSSLRMVCMDCGAELPGSNPQGARTSHGLCRVDFDRRMAELRAA